MYPVDTDSIPATLSDRLVSIIMQHEIDEHRQRILQQSFELEFFVEKDVRDFQRYTETDDFIDRSSIRTLSMNNTCNYLGVLIAIANYLEVRPCDIRLWQLMSSSKSPHIYRVDDDVALQDMRVMLTKADMQIPLFVEMLPNSKTEEENENWSKYWNQVLLVEENVKNKVKSYLEPYLLKRSKIPGGVLPYDVTEGMGIGCGIHYWKLLTEPQREDCLAYQEDLTVTALRTLATFYPSKLPATCYMFFFKIYDCLGLLPPLDFVNVVENRTDENETASNNSQINSVANNPTVSLENRHDIISLRYIGYSIIDIDGPFSEFISALKEMISRAFQPESIPDIWNLINRKIEVCCMKSPLKFVEVYSSADGDEKEGEQPVAGVLGHDVEGGDQMILQISPDFLESNPSLSVISDQFPLQSQRYCCSDWLNYIVHRRYVQLK